MPAPQQPQSPAPTVIPLPPLSPANRVARLAGALVILLILLAGFAYLMKTVFGSMNDAPKVTEIELPTGPRRMPTTGTRPSGGLGRFFGFADGVQKRPDGSAVVKSGNVWMRLTPRASQPGRPAISVTVSAVEVAAPPDVDAINAGRAIASHSDAAEKAGVTGDQLEKIRRLKTRLHPFNFPYPSVTLAAPDEQRLLELWSAYDRAAPESQAQADQNLRAALAELGTRAIPTLKTAAGDAAAAVRQLLTAEQIQAVRNFVPSKPTTRPAAKPQ